MAQQDRLTIAIWQETERLLSVIIYQTQLSLSMLVLNSEDQQEVQVGTPGCKTLARILLMHGILDGNVELTRYRYMLGEIEHCYQ